MFQLSYGRDLVNANCVTEKIPLKLFFGFPKNITQVFFEKYEEAENVARI